MLFRGFSQAIEFAIRGFWIWFQKHPVLRWMVLAPASAIFAKGVFELAGMLSSIFYGGNVVIGNDLHIQTLPFPVGLSIYLLFTLWVFTIVSVYLKLVKLWRRIEQLESQ